MCKQIKVTRQQAIDANCKECVGGIGNHGCGTWREQVQKCTGFDCPLYPYRPTPHGEHGKRGSTAIRSAKYARSDPRDTSD